MLRRYDETCTTFTCSCFSSCKCKTVPVKNLPDDVASFFQTPPVPLAVHQQLVEDDSDIHLLQSMEETDVAEINWAAAGSGQQLLLIVFRCQGFLNDLVNVYRPFIAFGWLSEVLNTNCNKCKFLFCEQASEKIIA
jgi:hypothetical protein